MTATERRRYTAFGLAIESDLAMPELVATTHGEPDLRIVNLGDPHPLTGREQDVAFNFREDRADGLAEDEMQWRDVAAFTVRQDHTIAYSSASGADDGFISLPLLGPVMAVLLHRRGRLTLHGSAVRRGDSAAVFLGDKGAGKSTTAAALVRSGHRLLTDDIVALDVGGAAAPRLWPAYPQLKLTPTATAAIALDEADAMESPHPDFPKQRHLLTGAFDLTSSPLGAVYVLERGEAFALYRLTGPAALTALMRFSYMTRFGSTLMRGQAAALHFQQCAAVANAAPVYRLVTPDSLDRLQEIDAFLQAEMQLPGTSRS